MPFRKLEPDTGFSAYAPEVPEEPAPVDPGPLGGIGSIMGFGYEGAKRRQEIIDAAFRMENDIVNTVDLITRPQYAFDPTFDVASRLKTDGLWDDYRDNFLGVGSEEEYLSVVQRINREEQDRATLAAAGTGGLLAQMGAGLISPTALLPFVGQARGARAIAQGVAWATVGGAAQEIPLQAAQETRTMQESVSSIAMSAVLGGVLGGAVAYARRTPKELADTLTMIEAGTAPSRGDTAISGSGLPSSIGAAAARDRAPELAGAFGLEDTVGSISPVTRVLTSPFQQAKWMMAQLADAGLEFAGSRMGKVAAVGGNVENRIKTYFGPVDKVMRNLDDAYARYWFGEGANKPIAVQRANLAGLNPNRVRMSKKEFREAVSRAMRNGDQSDIPEVAEIAKLVRREIYDPILKKAQEVGVFKGLAQTEDGETEVLGDLSYLNRVYNIDMIQARQQEFEDILASNYEQKLVDEFRTSFGRFQQRQQRDQERIEDFQRSPEEIAKLREQFEEQLRQLDEGRDAELVELEAAIFDQRAAARTFEVGTPERESALEAARALESEGGEALAAVRETRATIRRRLANLRRAKSALDERYQKKLDKIDRAEELSFATLQRLIRRGQKAIADMARISDERLDAEISKLKNEFAEAAQRLERNEDRIQRIFDDEFEADVPTEVFVAAARTETLTFDRMTQIAEALEEAENYPRQVAREMIQAGLDDATRTAQQIVERRAVRAERLRRQAGDLDPAAAEARIREIEENLGIRQQEFLDQWRERGADDIDPATGATNFKSFAQQMARATTDKILGTHMRLPGMDIIMEPRGAELARTLDIDSNLLRSQVDGRSFLEEDAEKLIMTYVRTMAPDIELTRALGDFAPDFGRNENFLRLADEVAAYKARVQEDMRNGINPDTGKKRTYTQEEIDKRGMQIAAQYAEIRKDFEAVIGRMRHTWGIPKDPRGFGARAARIASNVNTLRFMSNVAISSIPDIGRPIMKYGLLRTFRDGWVPFIKSLREGNFTPRQLRIAGAALDVTLHSRAAQVYDIGDYMVRGSKFEKGLEAATSKIGLIGLFDYWTAAMKQITGSVAVARSSDALSIVAGGAKASKRDVEEATRFLANGGIDAQLAERIWKQFTAPGGGEMVGGQWWPNTEAWTDDAARDAYNAMLVREVDNSIITPGVERPRMMDANPFMRLIFQFKSFGMSSTTRTFIAGAQALKQGDMAVVTGGLISLALGALSYYIAASIAGGTAKATMEKALADGDWEKFADEAINRSGLLGIGADLQSAFTAVPITAPYVSFTGERTTRRGGSNLLETLFGPTFGDTANTLANIATGVDEPTQATVHQLRTLMPLQNHFALRRLYDLIEQGAGGLPERRE